MKLSILLILLSVVVIGSVGVASAAVSDEDRMIKLQAGIDKLIDRINVLDNKKIGLYDRIDDIDSRIDGLQEKVYKKKTTMNNISNIPVFSEFALDSDNCCRGGSMTAHDGKLWVADPFHDKVFVYNRDGTRDEDSEFDLKDTRYVYGLTFLDDMVFVVGSWFSNNPAAVYAYHLNGTEIEGGYVFELQAEDPNGITAHDGKLWVLDHNGGSGDAAKVYVYNADGTRDAASDFDLDSRKNDWYLGFTVLNNQFYVIASNFDRSNNPLAHPLEVHVYNINGTRDEASEFDLDLSDYYNGSMEPSGIAALDGKLWVVDSEKVQVFGPNGIRP